MPHAHHFLGRLDRVTREQTEFALGLYRDEAAVRFVLERVNVPPDAVRVALALDDTRGGPCVVVTRDGDFVTCLGAGMKTDLPTIPRAQLDALLAKVADQRARREFAQRELRPDEEEDDLFQRIVTRGSRFSREDFRAVSAFESMFGWELYRFMLELALETIEIGQAMGYGAHRVTRMRTPTAKALERQDRLTWAIAHLMVLTGAGEREARDQIVAASVTGGSPTFACGAQGGVTFLLRGAWAAARLGKTAIPSYKSVFEQPSSPLDALEAGMALGAIAIRHASAMGPVRRILEQHQPLPGAVPADDVAAMRNQIALELLGTIDNVAERETRAIAVGRELCHTYGESLPEEHPLKFLSPDAVPEEVARTAVLAWDADIFDTNGPAIAMLALPTAARAQAEDFYFPRAIIRTWLGEWTPEETLDRVRRFEKTVPRVEPVRAAKTPGRNDPCHCGSGKKWKKCHGAGA